MAYKLQLIVWSVRCISTFPIGGKRKDIKQRHIRMTPTGLGVFLMKDHHPTRQL